MMPATRLDRAPRGVRVNASTPAEFAAATAIHRAWADGVAEARAAGENPIELPFDLALALARVGLTAAAPILRDRP